MRREKYVSLDIETGPETREEPWTGKDPTRAKLRTIGFGTAEWGLSYKWGTNRAVEHAIRQLLSSERGPVVVLHNGPWFDLRVLVRYGLSVLRWEDTRDARRALSSTSPLSLRYLASLYDDPDPWKEGEEDEGSGVVFTDDYEQLKRYNANDCVKTSRVWEGIQAEEEWNTPRVQLLYDVHKRLSVIAAEMHTHGFMLDKEMRKWMDWALQQEFAEKAEKLYAKVNLPGFKCNPNHMRALIYKRHEVTTEIVLPTGKKTRVPIAKFSLPDPIDPALWVDPKLMRTCSVDYDALVQLLIDPSTPKELKEIIKLYWDATEVKKRRGTYVTSELIDHALSRDGRLRAGWNSCGTDTGRFSGSEPNLMNIEQIMRAMYIAGPGCILVGADYSQLELRVMAAVAKDDVLQQFLKTGDVYTEDAKAFFKLPPETTKDTCDKTMRKAAKIIHLGSQYAAGTPTVYRQALAQDRAMTWQACQLLHNQFKRTYARTVKYWFEEQERVRATGYSESRILHRRRVYPREPPITEVANYPIQSTASDIANLALITLDRELKQHVPSAKILVQLHDAFYVECRKKDERAVRSILEDVMTIPHVIDGDSYEFPVEIKSSDRWSDL